ncbi:helix-turn-helix domain-containing protein [Halomicrococcus sp. NG-SE-24]|uniref:helix-turn-helix domain-containing protein n=1 Tax=Halomicrococcus sp. NG-SE-24 TaxID=3436928 RepID=UPI003D981F3C
MAVIVELVLDPEGFPLGQLLTADPGLYIHFEKVVPIGEQVVPLCWVWGGDIDAFEQRIRVSDHVLSFENLGQTGCRTLYTIKWDVPASSFFDALTDSRGSILDSFGHSDHDWEFQLLFPTNNHLSTFHDACRNYDIVLNVTRLYELGDYGIQQNVHGLTDKQQEALARALNRGYFASPQQVTLTELATEFDISQQALSQRLRRGNEAVLRSVLGTKHEENK